MADLKLDKTGNTDLGKTLKLLEDALNALPTSISTAGLTVATADASDLATAVALANALKTNFNLLITRLAAAQ